MIAVDLFCGAGGLTRGLLNAGIKVVLGVDVNDDYRRTYETNNRPAKFLCRDICDVTAADIRERLPKKRPYELALVGCAPCQPFSSHPRFRASCEQSRLLIEFARLITELKPDWVFMENVAGLSKVPGYSAYRRFTTTLSDLRYKFSDDTVDAKSFGVPQTRRRFVLLASRRTEVSLPEAVHGPGLQPYKTVREAISNLPAIHAGESHLTIPNHRAALITSINLQRLHKTPKNGGSRTAWPKTMTLTCHKRAKGHEDVYGRMRWDAPAPTLTCRCYSISNGRYGHPEQHRAISLREAARLQTFADDYIFTGQSQRSVGEQIGNAVPVALAESFGNQLLRLASTAKRARVKSGIKRRKKVRRNG